jgi:hypothetical protein
MGSTKKRKATQLDEYRGVSNFTSSRSIAAHYLPVPFTCTQLVKGTHTLRSGHSVTLRMVGFFAWQPVPFALKTRAK